MKVLFVKRSYKLLLFIAFWPALLLVGLRIALPQLSHYPTQIEQLLTRQLGVEVQLGGLQVNMQQWQIHARIENISLLTQDQQAPRLSFESPEVALTLDLWRTLRTQTLVFENVKLHQSKLLWQKVNGQWLQSTQSSEPLREERSFEQQRQPQQLLQLMQWIRLQSNIQIDQLALGLYQDNDDMQLIYPVNLQVENAQDLMQITGSASMNFIQETTSLDFVIRGENFRDGQLNSGDYDFYLSSHNLNQEVLSFLPISNYVKRFGASGQWWGRWSKHQLQWIEGNVEFAQVELPQPGWPVIDNFSTQFSLNIEENNRYQLRLSDFSAMIANEELTLPVLYTDWQKQQEQWLPVQIMTQQINVETLYHWASVLDHLPSEWSTVIDQLKPRGTIADLQVIWRDLSDWTSFFLQGQVQDLGINAWNHVPAVSGVNGSIEADLNSGQLHLDSQAFFINFASMYTEGWEYQSAKGRLQWHIKPTGFSLSSGVLEVANDELQAKGRFSIDHTKGDQGNTELAIMIGVTDSQASAVPKYMPSKWISSALRQWLSNAIEQGNIQQAGLLIQASMDRQEPKVPPSIEFFAEVDQANFNYSPEWPELEDAAFYVHWRDQALRIDVARAAVAGSMIENAWAYLPPKSSRLHVNGLLQGDSSRLTQLFKTTPLRQHLNDEILQWEFTGSARTNLALQIPVKNTAQTNVNVQTDFNAVNLRMPDRNLQFEKFKGAIHFSTQQGLWSESLTGQLFSQPLNVNIQSFQGETNIQAEALLDVKHLQDFTPFAPPAWLTGSTDMQANISLCAERSRCPKIDISSNLQGVTVNLPGELHKPSEQARSFTFSIWPAQQSLSFAYADALKGRLNYVDRFNGEILLGSESQFTHEQQEQLPFVWVKSSLPGLHLDAEVRQSDTWLNTWLVDIQKLHIDTALLDTHKEKLSTENTAAVNTSNPIDVSQWPAIYLNADQLSVNTMSLGQWSAEIRPEGDTVSLENWTINLPDHLFSGIGQWAPGSSGFTQIALDMQGGNLANLLKQFGQNVPIATEKIEAELLLGWTGNPWSFALEKLNGRFSFLASNGRIVETGAGGNLLRLFGILNISTIMRRLRFDFSDLYQEGISFDELKATYDIAEGVAKTSSALTLKGPSVFMEIAGETDLTAQRLDMDAMINLPLGSNMAIGAAMLGQPQIAGAILVLDFLFADRIRKATQIRYSITGHWKEPDITF